MASIKDIQNLDQKIDELRKKGRTDTDIVNVLAQGDQQFGSAIQKARSMGQNDRDLLNKTAVQFSGKMPTIQSVPLATETTQNAQNTTVQPSTTQPSTQQPPKLKFTDLALLKPIQTAKNFFSAEKESLTNRKERVGESFNAYQKGEQGLASTDFQVAGNVVGGVIGDTFMNVAKSLWRTLPEDQREQTKAGAKEGLANFAKQVADAQVRKYEQMKINEPEKARQIDELIGKVKTEVNEIQVNPEKQRNFEAALDLTDLVGLGFGKKVIKDGAKPIVETIETGLRKLPPPGPDDFAKLVPQGAKDFVEGSKDFIKQTVQSTSDIAKGVKERIPQNIAETKIRQEALKSMPETAQKAVRSGVLERDANTVLSLNKEEINLADEMLSLAKNFESNRLSKDPGEIVGNVLRKPIIELEAQRKQVGEQLGEMVKGLPTQFVKVKDNVIKSLQEVEGLQGIKVRADGKLDFRNTRLSGSLTSADRKVIQKAYEDLIGRNPYRLHRLRQELFEVLGGKKKALVQLTDTQEQGLEAIRKGISDTLDELSPTYKALNKEYAEIVGPIKDIRKFFKNIEGADGDILDMRAGLLARRLTSNTVSGQEIRQVLRSIGELLEKKGIKQTVSVEKLQDLFNALERYYDISKDTGLAGQIQTALPTGKRDLIAAGIEAIAKKGLKTPATQRAAFEELIQSLKPRLKIPKKSKLPQPNEQAYGA